MTTLTLSWNDWESVWHRDLISGAQGKIVGLAPFRVAFQDPNPLTIERDQYDLIQTFLTSR